MTKRSLAVASASILILAGLAAACGTSSAAPTQTPSPVPATPTASPTPTLAPTPSPTPTITPSPTIGPFSLVKASNCNPSLVPDAIPAPLGTPHVSARFVLKVPILMYHRIVPFSLAGDSNGGLVVSPPVFANQLEELQQAGWQTITLGQLAEDLEAGIRPAPKTFVITIDDGWGDGYDYAFPILQHFGFVATYFVIAARINKPGFLTADQLRALTEAGDEIGDHTVDHQRLGARRTLADLRYQIDTAAASIALATGKWPETLAYPYGSVSATAEKQVAACTGMKMAVVEGQGAYETWATRFQVPRIRVSNGTSPQTLLGWVQYPVFNAATPAPRPTAAPTSSPSSPLSAARRAS